MCDCCTMRIRYLIDIYSHTNSQSKHSGTHITSHVCIIWLPYVNSIINCSILFHIFVFVLNLLLLFSFISFSSRNMKLKLNYINELLYVVCCMLTPVYIFRLVFIEFPFCDLWLHIWVAHISDMLYSAHLLDSIQFFTFWIVFHLVLFFLFSCILLFSVQVPSSKCWRNVCLFHFLTRPLQKTPNNIPTTCLNM